jgi:hypothetical protein
MPTAAKFSIVQSMFQALLPVGNGATRMTIEHVLDGVEKFSTFSICLA